MNDILSQDEVDALLKGVAEGTTPQEGTGEQASGVRSCDLTSPERALSGRLPGLDRIFDSYLRLLRTSLEGLLGEIGGLTLASVELVRYGSWVRQLAVPVSVNMFRMNPLNYNGLVVLSPPLASAALEVAFGGKARRQALVEGREYSGIETRVLQRFVTRVLGDFQEAWQPIEHLEFSVVRSESNPAHAPVATDDAVALLTEFRVLLEADEGLTLTICIPYSALDSVRQKLTGEFGALAATKGKSWAGQLQGRIGEIKLGVKAELGSCHLNMREVLTLKPGDVITLERRRDEPVFVHVEDLPKFYGVPGLSREGHAVRILGPLNEGPSSAATC
jgi:flagellar motor switch protein FliM